MRITHFIPVLFAAFSLLAAPPAADPAKAGMDAAQLSKIAPRMKTYAADQLVPGTVTLIMRKNALAHLETAGFADVEKKTPMRPDTIFQIMSMTKPFTGAAIMMLAEEGKVRLTDPVEKYLPDFKGQWLIASEQDGVRILKKPSRLITVRDLMTHTSGLGNAPPAIGNIMVSLDRTLADACLLYSQLPLEFEPGTRWQYSNVGIAILGRIVEVQSGLSFERFLETRIFQPLGMTDSHIFLPESKYSRLAPVYTQKNGQLQKSGPGILAGDPLQYRKGAKYPGPEHGMYSTAWDLAQFYSMMLNKGTWNGKRLLSPQSVAEMTTVHTGDIKAGHDPGVGFGLTWAVTKDPIGTLYGHSLGTFGHGGAFGTYGWVDPKKEVVGVFMVQGEGLDTKTARDSFLNMSMAAILD